MGSCDRMHVAGEMQVNLVRRHHVSLPATSSTTFDAKYRPREGSRSVTTAFLPDAANASAKPIAVVVFPSPAGVGFMDVTKTSFPFCSPSAPKSTL